VQQAAIRDNMKGQIFIAGAALFVVLLALIATSFAPMPAVHVAIALSPQLDDIAQEYRYTTALLSLSKTDYLDDLSAYFRDKVQGFDAIYALVSVKPNAYDLTIGDFLRNPATVGMAAANSNPPTASGVLADKETKTWSFSASGDVQLTINYTFQNATYTKSLDFATDKNQTISWFDIGITADRNSIRQSGIWNITAG